MVINRKRTRYTCSDERLKCMRDANLYQGVVVDPLPVTAGEEVTFLYHGMLEQNGAEQV